MRRAKWLAMTRRNPFRQGINASVVQRSVNFVTGVIFRWTLDAWVRVSGSKPVTLSTRHSTPQGQPVAVFWRTIPTRRLRENPAAGKPAAAPLPTAPCCRLARYVPAYPGAVGAGEAHHQAEAPAVQRAGISHRFLDSLLITPN